ncbi:hypothetical protein, partial [Porticoccus sp.]|uniref:hypothetical protein n=1 Tax=Porticoccus sp. TaxID=2024853 RepID=UPI003F6A4C70
NHSGPILQWSLQERQPAIVVSSFNDCYKPVIRNCHTDRENIAMLPHLTALPDYLDKARPAGDPIFGVVP